MRPLCEIKSKYVIMLTFLWAGTLFAGTDWLGLTDSWNTASKWSWNYTVPSPLETANIYQGLDNYPIISDGISASINELYIGFYSGNGRVDMTGGSLTTQSAMVLGVHDGLYGEFNMSGGTVALGGHLYMGLTAGTTARGKMNITDGNLTLNTLVMTYSSIDNGMVMNIGGNATVSILAHWIDQNGKALINISNNGTLILDGDQISNYYVGDWELLGVLSANGGTGTLVYDYNITNSGKTTIKAYSVEKATRPYPVDGAVNVDPNYTLSWQSGALPVSQNIFLGTNYTEVLNAQPFYGDLDGDGLVDMHDMYIFAQQWLADLPTVMSASGDFNDDNIVNLDDFSQVAGLWANSGDGIFKGHLGQGTNMFSLSDLEPDSTLFWRVDGINSDSSPYLWKGDVWSFSTLLNEMIPNEIVLHNGAPAFSINGQVEFPMLNFQTVQTEDNTVSFRNADFTLFSFVGNWSNFGLDIGWSGGNVQDANNYNYNQVDVTLDEFSRRVPDGLCIPRVWVGAAEWWIDAHPGEAVGFADGTGWVDNDWGGTKHESFASQLWFVEYGEAFRRFVRHLLDAPYADQVLGIHISSGIYGEWHGWSTTNYPDTSEPMRQALIQYLQEKYGGDVQVLRNAWGDQGLTFDTVSIPTLAERLQSGDVGMFRDPGVSRKLMDYYECYNRVTVKAIDYFASIVKQESEGKLLTMALYNYIPDFAWPLEGDHRAAALAMRSENIDIFASPHTYSRRQLGEDGMFRNFPASMALHNKLFLDEGDGRTHLAPEGWPVVYASNMEESLQVIRREFSNVVTNSVGMYYMDQSGTFFNDPCIMADMANIKHWADYSMNLPRNSVNEVAVISALESEFYMASRVSGENRVAFDLYGGQIKELCQTGAPFDWYLIEDLEEGLIPPHKAYVFLDAFYLTSSQRTAIEGLKSDDRTLVWFYAPGFVSSDRLSLTDMELLTGFSFTQISPRDLRVNLNPAYFPGVSDFGTWSTQSPVFMPGVTSAEILGTYSGSSDPALVSKSFGAWRSIYCPGASLPAAVLREIFSDAGVHIYLDSGDNLTANQSWIGIHTSSAGVKTINLPNSLPVYDVINNTLISSGTTQFQVELDAEKTAVYMLAEPE